MIGVIFEFASEIVEVRVDGNHVLFRSGTTPQWATIDNLNISYRGVCIEFPDLEKNPDWKQEAICRFKKKIADMITEEEKINYIIDDLKKHGYIPKYKQRAGWRKTAVK